MIAKIENKKVKGSRAKKENTKDKIIAKSLELFNSRGERNITTNHIASELGMSPGNLYYHFKNKKDIIYELFLRYERIFDEVLSIPENEEINFVKKKLYFEGLFEAMWHYRFLHCNIVHLLEADERLRERYNEFGPRTMRSGYNVYKALVNNGMIVATDEEIKALVLNIWVICFSWITFLHTSTPELAKGGSITKEMLMRGIYQVICIEAPYLSEQFKSEHLPSLKEIYSVEDQWSLPVDRF